MHSYQGFISDQGIPDAGHGLANAQVGVKLVAVKTGYELGQEWSQLLSGLSSDHVETKSCSLKGGQVGWKERFNRWKENWHVCWPEKRFVSMMHEQGTLREFHMA